MLALVIASVLSAAPLLCDPKQDVGCVDEAAEKQDRARRMREFRAVPGVMVAEWSAIRCFWQDYRAFLKKQANTEQKYGAEFGAVNLDKLYRARTLAEMADRQRKAAEAELLVLRAKPRACSETLTAEILMVIHGGDDSCTDDGLRAALDLAYDLDPQIRSAE